MRVQIVVTPPLKLDEMPTYPPYGALYIAGALKEKGHEVRIENGHLEQLDYNELCRRIKEFSPDIVGFSDPVSTFYKYVKEASFFIRKQFPALKMIVGGPLTAAAEVVLKNSEVDIAVLGEGELTIKELAAKIADKRSYHDVNGIMFKEGNRLIRTPARAPIADLDSLAYPPFDLIDMKRYLFDVKKFVTSFLYYKNIDPRLFEAGRSKMMFRVPVSRGCINCCSFCYRHMRGIRHFSLKYIFDFVEYLMDKFKINVFSFGDECFAPNKAWNWKFLDELKRRKLDIVFQILGTPVRTVDRDILRAYKEAGCFMIEYGFESGSQKMLDMMEKSTTVEINTRVARWTRDAGLFTMPAFVLGMPGETSGTVRETIDFLKAIDYGPDWYQHTYAFAVPGTPLYDYAVATRLISDEDHYLEACYGLSPNTYLQTPLFINFTSEPLSTVRQWPKMLSDGLLRKYGRNVITYSVKKFRRSFTYHLRRYGIRKTAGKIKDKFFRGRQESAAASEAMRGDDGILKAAQDYIKKHDRGISLRQVLKHIEDVHGIQQVR